MEIKIGMYFKGDINGKIIRIINASNQAITYVDVESGRIFTVGRKMFEHCYLTRVDIQPPTCGHCTQAGRKQP